MNLSIKKEDDSVDKELMELPTVILIDREETVLQMSVKWEQLEIGGYGFWRDNVYLKKISVGGPGIYPLAEIFTFYS